MSEVSDAAQSFEGSLMILRKDKNGWVFGLSVHPSEAPSPLLDAPLGTRFQCVLFQVSDNEEFVPNPDGKRAVAKAGELCRKQDFHDYLCDLDGSLTGADKGVSASQMLRSYLKIDSRSELQSDHRAREEFNDLVSCYMEFRGDWSA